MNQNNGPGGAPSQYTSSSSYSEVAYTNPVTGISFTRRELYQYAQGQKKNEKGDVVFFRPSFIDEDPWKHLRQCTEPNAKGPD
jgi:hypothetical protein